MTEVVYAKERKGMHMGYTIATHNGSIVAREHNIRNRNVTDKEQHIDPNGHFEIWHDEKVRDAYHRLFDDAVREYNDKQTRDDRKIDNYYNQIKKDSKKHACYEMIISIGNRDNMVNEKLGHDIMKEFVDGWKERNPNLELIGAYYHNDEDGVPHVHCDYIPVAHGYTKGMETQNGLVKALGEMGFEKQGRITAQIQWQQRENNTLETLCKAHNLIIDHPREENRKHIDTEQYKATQRLNKTIDHTNDLDEQNNRLEKEIERKIGDIQKADDILPVKPNKTIFGKEKDTITISRKEYDSLYKTAKAVEDVSQTRHKNRADEERIKKKDMELGEREYVIAYREKSLEIDERAYQDKVQLLNRDRQEFDKCVEQEASIIAQNWIDQTMQQDTSTELQRLQEFVQNYTVNGTNILELFQREEIKRKRQLEIKAHEYVEERVYCSRDDDLEL